MKRGLGQSILLAVLVGFYVAHQASATTASTSTTATKAVPTHTVTTITTTSDGKKSTTTTKHSVIEATSKRSHQHHFHGHGKPHKSYSKKHRKNPYNKKHKKRHMSKKSLKHVNYAPTFESFYIPAEKKNYASNVGQVAKFQTSYVDEQPVKRAPMHAPRGSPKRRNPYMHKNMRRQVIHVWNPKYEHRHGVRYEPMYDSLRKPSYRRARRHGHGHRRPVKSIHIFHVIGRPKHGHRHHHRHAHRPRYITKIIHHIVPPSYHGKLHHHRRHMIGRYAMPPYAPKHKITSVIHSAPMYHTKHIMMHKGPSSYHQSPMPKSPYGPHVSTSYVTEFVSAPKTVKSVPTYSAPSYASVASKMSLLNKSVIPPRHQ